MENVAFGQRGDVNSARGGLHYLLSRPTYGGIAEPRRAHRGLQPEVDLDGQRFADGGNLGEHPATQSGCTHAESDRLQRGVYCGSTAYKPTVGVDIYCRVS